MTAESRRMRVIVADDELYSRRRLISLLASEHDCDIVAECADGRATAQAICALKPDLVLLDIQMPKLNGFDMLRSLPSTEAPYVIFVTAFDQYALQAFDIHAVDYLLKPYEESRFRVALSRARNRLHEAGYSSGTGKYVDTIDQIRPANRRLTRICIREAGREMFFSLSSVTFIQSDGNYATFHVDGKKRLLRVSLDSLEPQLDPSKFVRVSRNAIINLSYLQAIERHPRKGHVASLQGGAKVKISRRRHRQLIMRSTH